MEIMNGKISLLVLIILLCTLSCVEEKKIKVDKNNILSEGILTRDSIRDGFWVYNSKNGEFLAKGDYNNGLKKGRWEYKDLKYNNTYFIDWRIISNANFEINIPLDWKVKEAVNSPVHTIFIMIMIKCIQMVILL